MAITENVVVKAFDMFGGDPANAVAAARSYSSVGGWVASQAAQAAAVGAGAMAIPGAHVATMAGDLCILLHKMAYCSWGIGAIRGKEVHGLCDLEIILAHWSGAVGDDAIAAGVSVGIVGGVIYVAGVEKLMTTLVGMAASGVATAGAAKLGIKGAGKAAIGNMASYGAKKLSVKLAPKIAAKLGTKVGAKGLAGFVPFLGPAVGASVNAYFVKRVADSADFYYSNKWRLEAE